MADGDRFDVFLSYSRSDAAAASELNRWLRARGFRTFFDQNDLKPGLRWVSALEDSIERSDSVAVLVGRNGMGNTQQYERELALVRQSRDDKFPVIPVLMPGCDSPPTGFLQILTWIDLSRDSSVLQQTESLELLCGAIRRHPVPPSVARTQICPYRGLEPFREEDAAFFCGRDDAIRDLVSQVQAYPFVAVVGASGTGKSSLVFAGLLPALRRQREKTMWDVVSFRPGASPLRALARVFATIPENIGLAAADTVLENEVAAYRAGDPGKLARIANDRLDAAPEKPERLLVYVDQWEELYAMAPTVENAEQRRQHSEDVDKFIALLFAAASGPTSRVTVVLTVRADFYNPLIRHALLSSLLPRQQVNITPMDSKELRSAIEMPAERAKLSFIPPALVDQILNDVGTEEGRLPLLQFALKETWERREGDRLTAEAYTEVGGVTGAIRKTAERAYAALTPAQQQAARRLFLRLVTPGEGQEDTRARSAMPDDPQQRDIINLFSSPKTRLLVTDYDAIQESTPSAGQDQRATVEVAHEALIRRWPTLRAWVDDNREKLRARAAILRAKAEWDANGHIDKFLLDPGIQLERGRSLLESPGDVPVDDLRDYVDRSIKRETQRLEAEREAAVADQKRIADAERQAREAAEGAARVSEAARAAADVAQRKLRNRWRMAVSAMVVALVAFGVSAYQWVEARNQLDRANQALAIGILAEVGSDSEATPLIARQRNALWKLAAADPAVRAYFVSALAASRDDMKRSGSGFREISRSLGPQWPQSEDADRLFRTAVDAVAANRGPVDPLEVLTPKLTHAQDALEPLLNLIAEKTDGQGQELGKLVQILRELPARPTDERAQQVLRLLLRRAADNAAGFYVLAWAEAFKAFPADLTDTNARQEFTSLLKEFREKVSPGDPGPGYALVTLATKLTDAQSQFAFDQLMKQVGETGLPEFAFETLVEALEALAPKLTGVQAQQALVFLPLTKMANSSAVRSVARTLELLGPRLSDAQAQEALPLLLAQMNVTDSPSVLLALASALKMLPAKLSEEQARQALIPLLKQIGEKDDPAALRALAMALQAVPAKLSEAQAQQALEPLQKRIDETWDVDALRNLAEALRSVATKLDGAQTARVQSVLVKQIEPFRNPYAFRAFAHGFEELPAKLSGTQTQEVLVSLLEEMGQRPPLDSLLWLAEELKELPTNLTDAQAQQALTPVLDRLGKRNDMAELKTLTRALRALVARLTATQSQQAASLVLKSFGNPTVYYALAALAPALEAPLTDPQAREALDLFLKQIAGTTISLPEFTVEDGLVALVSKLTEAQAQEALNPLLKQISETIRYRALETEAQALQVLAAKLTSAQSQQALNVAASSLAWASEESEAEQWARALVALLPSRMDQSESQILVNAIIYPTAAGPATEVLLKALRARQSDMPREESGTLANLAWIAEKYPDQTVRPDCPPPPQPTSLSALKCPVELSKSPSPTATRKTSWPH